MAKTSREFTVRSLSAAVLAPAAIGLAWLGGVYLTVGMAVVAGTAILELRRISIAAGWGFALIPALLFAAALIVRPQLADAHRPTLYLASAVLIALTLAISLATRPRRRRAVAWLAGIAGAAYVAGLGSALVSLRGLSEGFTWVLLAFAGTWVYDTGGYLGGKFFGKHLLAPRISPKKTWEGVAAGTGALLICVAVFSFFLAIEPWHIPVLALLVAAAAQVGDLFESGLKRTAGVKNSGALIPGHGGILDRVDSLLVVALVVYVYALLVTNARPFV